MKKVLKLAVATALLSSAAPWARSASADPKPAKDVPAKAPDAPPPAPATAPPAPTGPVTAPATPPPATAAPAKRGIDDLLEEAGKSAIEKPKEEAPKAVKPKGPDAKQLLIEKAAKEKEARKAAEAAKEVKIAPSGPATDDNDGTLQAAAPTALAAVASTGKPRKRGPYEIGNLDCRILDGAGIERIMPKKVTAGEEPDLLCRIIITQPGDVLPEEHSVFFTVTVGGKETFKDTRKVRMSSIGRRALVFVVPADKISSDETAPVRIQAVLSAPASPGGGQSKQFTVETVD